MAPAASTTTSSVSQRKATAANGKTLNGSAANANGMDSSERDAIEAKYKDFFWTYTEEPHRTRRLAIIKAHPEVIIFFLLL